MHEATNLSAPAGPSASAAEDETLPETAPAKRETKQLGRGGVVVHLLADIRCAVAPLPQGKQRRALTSKLDSLQFVVDAWAALPPRPEQVSAMLDVLLRVQEAAEDAAASRC
jgi:hypothetical protein